MDSVVYFVSTYPVKSVINLLNNWGMENIDSYVFILKITSKLFLGGAAWDFDWSVWEIVPVSVTMCHFHAKITHPYSPNKTY